MQFEQPQIVAQERDPGKLKQLFERVKDRTVEKFTLELITDYADVDEITLRNVRDVVATAFDAYCAENVAEVANMRDEWTLKSVNVPSDERSLERFEETLSRDFSSKDIVERAKAYLRKMNCLRLVWNNPPDAGQR